ncbi:AraC family transcriptional regulator [Ideonella livida]|uniref:AraC family transcriptional regulator n=1 Tax=Ideonella livida TaxID=2707176 RepID=A0A7C9TMB2_9BURK|nr:AraC family transcriptional regulator [Ideonella livida]NDY92505.1 AraC family transcriptional regulator [Ideonella livida]
MPAALPPLFTLRRYGPSKGSHDHAHFQVLVPLDGALELEVSGRGCRLLPGQGLRIAPGERHDFEAPGGSRCLVLDTADDQWACRTAQAQAGAPLAPLADFMAQALDQGLPVSPLHAAQLLVQAWAHAPTATRPLRREIDWTGLQRWVTHRLGAPLCAADLAAQAGLGESQFRARCLLHTGLTPMQWVRQLRLTRARALRAQGLGVAETARRVGYDSPSALTAALRRPPPP